MLKVIQKLKIGPAIGLGVISTIAVTMPAYAEPVTQNYSLTASVNSDSELSLSLTKTSGVLNLAPGYDKNSPASSSVSTTVTVKARDGYQLFMTGDTALTDKNTSETIPALVCTNNASTCDLTNNSWGFSVGAENTNFRGFTIELYRVGDGSGDTTGNYTLNFGAKVDYKTSPGVYTNLISLIAVANPSTVYMQDMSPYYCTTDRATTVTDSRDGTTYNVQRLKDGNCWMLDNLALGSTETTYTLTSGDTNLPDGASFILPKSKAGISGDNRWIDSYTAAYINTEGNCVNSEDPNQYPCRDSNGNLNSDGPYNKNESAPLVSDYSIGKNGSGKIGTYYNYCAASAGTYCKPNNSTATVPEGGSVISDVCPKGWRLPTGSDSGEFRALYQAYGGSATGTENNTSFKAALATPLSGNYWSGSAHAQGASGGFWSSTWQSNAHMYNLNVTVSNINPANANFRSNGRSVRCLLADL